MNPLDWTDAFDKHRGKWVAFKRDHKTVAGSGGTLRAAKNDAAKNGCADPILTRLPKTLRNFIGSHIS